MGPSWTPLNAINTTSVTLKCNIVIRDMWKIIKDLQLPAEAQPGDHVGGHPTFSHKGAGVSPCLTPVKPRRQPRPFPFHCSALWRPSMCSSFWKQQCHILAFAWTPQAPRCSQSPWCEHHKAFVTHAMQLRNSFSWFFWFLGLKLTTHSDGALDVGGEGALKERRNDKLL